MGRPKLDDVRRPQILDAFAACVARYGIDGSTLDRVAEEAGVTRALVRHYLGNRDEVVVALAEHVTDRDIDPEDRPGSPRRCSVPHRSPSMKAFGESFHVARRPMRPARALAAETSTR